MASFRFRLAAPLRAREAARDERRVLLAEAESTARTIGQRQEAVELELVALERMRQAATGPGTLDVARLVQLQNFAAGLRRELETLAAQAAEAAVVVDRRRAELQAADRDVKTLEKLRERQVDRHRQQQATREAAQLDEIATKLAQGAGDHRR